jgi:hypothetical protein
MAAISPISGPQGSQTTLVTATAQADTGQTTWLSTPSWAKSMTVYLNYTATAGTTPLLDFKLLEADPVARDDAAANSVNLADWDGITQIAGASAPLLSVVQVGPGITGIADDDTGPYYKVNTALPPLLGFKVTLDRTTGNETYTYTLAVAWHK